MKTANLFCALVIVLMTCVQCTEDETIEASVNQIDNLTIESGEEGSDGTDNDKDEDENEN